MDYGNSSRFASGLSFVAACFFCGSASIAFANSTSGGPDGGGVYGVYASSSATAEIYASAPNGMYRSSDDGRSWVKQPYGIASSVYETVFSGPQGAFAVGLDCVSLYRSIDHGQTWQRAGYVAADYQCIKSITMTASPGARLLIGKSHGEILASDDDGATFFPAMEGLPMPAPSDAAVDMLAASPEQPGLVLAIVKGDIYRSLDAGMTWTYIQPSFGYHGGQIRFGSEGVVYLSGLGMPVSRSFDGGVSWTACSSLPTTSRSIVVDAQSDNALYFIDSNLGHLYVSNDYCATATDLSDGFSLDGQVKPRATGMAISEQSGNLLLATDVGIYRRNGNQWLPQNEGLRATPVRSFWADPNKNGRLFAGHADNSGSSPGIFRSDDAGASWTVSNHGLFAESIRALTADATTTANTATTILYATGTASWDEDNGMGHAGLWKSGDGGASWAPIEGGIPAGSFGPFLGVVRALVLDPRSCANPPPAPAPCQQGPLQTAYAVSDGDWSSSFQVEQYRIIKTQDGGAHWIDIDGLPKQVIDPDSASAVTAIALAIDPLDPGRLYVGTSYSAYDTTPSIESGVFRSDDGGASWNLMSSGLPLVAGSKNTHDGVYAVAVDPEQPSTLWAATMAEGADASHIYKSNDAGASWFESDSGITAGDIRQIVVDRRTSPPTLYAAAIGVGIYRSRDGGGTWRSISVGLPLSGASAVALDPHDPLQLYVGTAAGVFTVAQQMDADEDGAPDSIEQSGPNGGDANADGIADAEQANVAVVSLPGEQTEARGRDRATVYDAEGLAVIEVIPDAAGTCEQIVDAQPIPDGERVSDVEQGLGLKHEVPSVRFEVLDCPSATIKLTYTNATFDDATRLRFFGPSELPYGSMYWYGMEAERQGTSTLIFHLAAGQRGSWRPQQAGSILFEGGPAQSEQIFRDGFDDLGRLAELTVRTWQSRQRPVASPLRNASTSRNVGACERSGCDNASRSAAWPTSG